MPCAFEGQGWSPDHLTDCPFPSFQPELPNCLHLEPVMVCIMIKITSKFNFEKKKKRTGMEPYTVTIVGTEVFVMCFCCM